MKRPWMPLWPRDYLADTQHLSTIEHGAYCLLIMNYWMHGGLPDDDRQLAKVTGLSIRSWRRMRPTLETFFYDGWNHKRIDQDLTKVDKIAEQRRFFGARGGAATKRANLQPVSSNYNDLLKAKALAKASANEQQKLQQKLQQKPQQKLKLTEEEDIESYTGAAREVPKVEPKPEPLISEHLGAIVRAKGWVDPNRQPAAELADSPAGLAMKAREKLAEDTSIGTGLLAQAIKAKGWAG